MNPKENELHPMTPPLPGFEAIQRYWDPKRNTHITKIQPGEFYVTTNAEAITTVLGSCVSACIRDSALGIGGMNHFMLPLKGSIYDKSTLVSGATLYGNWAMEYLINQILKAGGRRRMLEVKVFGGGNVLASLSPKISEQNIKFVEDYLYNENLKVSAKDLGGEGARMLIYYPKSGLVQMKILQDSTRYEIAEKEGQYNKSIDRTISSKGDVELF